MKRDMESPTLMRHPRIKHPRVPIPARYVVGSRVHIGEGEGVIVAISLSHVICSMMAGDAVLGYQIYRWDTRQEPTWQCAFGGWHLYRTAAERHLAWLIKRGG